MYRKLKDRHKHKTIYPQRTQYCDKSYNLSLLLKLRTLSHETPFIWQIIPNRHCERLQKKSCKRYFLITFSNLKIMATSVRVKIQMKNPNQ